MIVTNRTDVVMDAGSAKLLGVTLMAMDREEPNEHIPALQLRVLRACLFRRPGQIVRFKIRDEAELEILLEAVGR